MRAVCGLQARRGKLFEFFPLLDALLAHFEAHQVASVHCLDVRGGVVEALLAEEPAENAARIADSNGALELHC
jgi:hypothetical protein